MDRATPLQHISQEASHGAFNRVCAEGKALSTCVRGVWSTKGMCAIIDQDPSTSQSWKLVKPSPGQAQAIGRAFLWSKCECWQGGQKTLPMTSSSWVFTAWDYSSAEAFCQSPPAPPPLCAIFMKKSKVVVCGWDSIRERMDDPTPAFLYMCLSLLITRVWFSRQSHAWMRQAWTWLTYPVNTQAILNAWTLVCAVIPTFSLLGGDECLSPYPVSFGCTSTWSMHWPR